MNLGKILQEEREKQRLSKKQLAKMANVSDTIISYWESGKREMTVKNADKIFKALGVVISIGGEKDAKNSKRDTVRND